MNSTFGPRIARLFATALALLVGQLGLASTAQAQLLNSCKGYSANGDAECTVVPHNVTAWKYWIPGPIRGTPYLDTASAAIETYKGYIAANAGAQLCSSVQGGIGTADATIVPSGWDFKRLFLWQRWSATFTYGISAGANSPCEPRSLTTVVVAAREASCDMVKGWSLVNDAATTFCIRANTFEDRTCPTANPVLPGSGVKVLTSTDYTGAGAHPLEFSRTYRSRWARANVLATMGGLPSSVGHTGWLHNYERQITDVPGAPAPMRRALRPDGTVNTFTAMPDAQGFVHWRPEIGVRDTLLPTASGWDYKVFADDSIERYDTTGKLLSITARNGWLTTLTYSDATTTVDVAPKPGLLIRVANHFGRTLSFVYEPGGRLASMVDPGGGAIHYSYDGFGNLASVTWQDNTTRQYHHEDSRFVGHVTGITDEAGARYSTYSYDDQGRVASSELAGGAERMSFTYNGSFSYVRDSVSTGRTYHFTNTAGVLRTSGVSQPCPLCGNTAQTTVYDANANKTKEVAHDGAVTFTTYDTKGRETERATFPASFASAATRPALASASKVVSTKWHATWMLPTQLAEPNKTTANTYNSKGLLTGQSWTATTDATGAAKFSAVKTGSTYATGWSYSASSLLTSLVNKTDGVVTAQTSYVVNAQGITTKGTDVLTGKAITVGTSTSNGRPKSGTDAAGTLFSIAYSVTGKPTAVTIGTQPPNRFIYDARGGLSRLEAADGSVIALTPPTNAQSSSSPAFASMAQANAAAVVSGAAPSPISGSASACVAVGQAAKVPSKCCEGSACRVYCTGVPGNAPVYCTRVEYSTGSGWRTTNVGLYSWLDRPFNFVGQFTCVEFDQLLGDGRCGNGACLAATTR